MEVHGKRCQENGPKAEKSGRTRQKNKTGDIEKWDQTDSSPELPDRGETSEIPGLHSGGSNQ